MKTNNNKHDNFDDVNLSHKNHLPVVSVCNRKHGFVDEFVYNSEYFPDTEIYICLRYKYSLNVAMKFLKNFETFITSISLYSLKLCFFMISLRSMFHSVNCVHLIIFPFAILTNADYLF